MRRISQQRHAIGRPALDRISIANAITLIARRRPENRQRFIGPAVKCLHHRVRVDAKDGQHRSAGVDQRLRHVHYRHHIHQFGLACIRGKTPLSGVSYQCRENDRRATFREPTGAFRASAKASLLDWRCSSAQYDARMSALRTTPSMAVVSSRGALSTV